MDHQTKMNPDFDRIMERRRSAQRQNRAVLLGAGLGIKVSVPKQPNRYMPHIGAKESVRHAGKTSLGPNASRVLQNSTSTL